MILYLNISIYTNIYFSSFQKNIYIYTSPEYSSSIKTVDVFFGCVPAILFQFDTSRCQTPTEYSVMMSIRLLNYVKTRFAQVDHIIWSGQL